MVREQLNTIFNGERAGTVISHGPDTASSVKAVFYVAAGADGVNDFFENGIVRVVGVARYGAHYPAALAARTAHPTAVIEEHRYDATSIPEQHEHASGMCRRFLVSGAEQEKVKGLSPLERQYTSERLGYYVGMLLDYTFLDPYYSVWSDLLHDGQDRHSPAIRTLHMAMRGGDLFVHSTLNSGVRYALVQARQRRQQDQQLAA